MTSKGLIVIQRTNHTRFIPRKKPCFGKEIFVIAICRISQHLDTEICRGILGILKYPFRILLPIESALLCLELLATLEEKLRFLWRR